MQPPLGEGAIVTAPDDHDLTINTPRLRRYRHERVQEQLRLRDYGACLLYDPINIRYATGTRNMMIWTMHNAARYCMVFADGGPSVLFEPPRCAHLAAGIETVGEIRPAIGWYYYYVGARMAERIQDWSAEISSLMTKRCGSNRRLAVDHVDGEGRLALSEIGLQLFNGQEPMEFARCTKSADEIACMLTSIAVCEAGLFKLREAVEPGRSEIELWSILNNENSEAGGEYLETKLLSSGTRTNPWSQECSHRRVRPGELVAVDTDMVGPYGYNSDLSRTFYCGPGKATDRQRRIYGMALEQLHHNIETLQPGTPFRELAAKAWRVPEAYAENSDGYFIHGIGMCNEYPKVTPGPRFESAGYDGILEPQMTVCVESYIGEAGGPDGVKLEQQVLITEKGPRVLSSFPFEEALIS